MLEIWLVEVLNPNRFRRAHVQFHQLLLFDVSFKKKTGFCHVEVVNIFFEGIEVVTYEPCFVFAKEIMNIR